MKIAYACELLTNQRHWFQPFPHHNLSNIRSTDKLASKFLSCWGFQHLCIWLCNVLCLLLLTVFILWPEKRGKRTIWNFVFQELNKLIKFNSKSLNSVMSRTHFRNIKAFTHRCMDRFVGTCHSRTFYWKKVKVTIN